MFLHRTRFSPRRRVDGPYAGGCPCRMCVDAPQLSEPSAAVGPSFPRVGMCPATVIPRPTRWSAPIRGCSSSARGLVQAARSSPPPWMSLLLRTGTTTMASSTCAWMALVHVYGLVPWFPASGCTRPSGSLASGARDPSLARMCPTLHAARGCPRPWLCGRTLEGPSLMDAPGSPLRLAGIYLPRTRG